MSPVIDGPDIQGEKSNPYESPIKALSKSYQSPIKALFMIRLSVDDPIASVDLFQENHPHQLMGKGHL
jgi:hypothetical protein